MTAEDKRAYNRRYYLANGEAMRRYTRDYQKQHGDIIRGKARKKHSEKRAAKQAAIDKIKSQPCKDCQQIFHPVCMDFDHLPGVPKLMGVALMVNQDRFTVGDVLQETSKCEVVCSNCHRIRTHLHRKHKQPI